MGFFSKHKSHIINPDSPIPRGPVPPGPYHTKPNSHSTTSNSQHTAPNSESNPSKFDIAMKYFNRQQIQCASSIDRETIERIYASLTEDNYNTSEDDTLSDAVDSLDTNIFNLSRAIILQNFMMMRKIDALSERVKKLESELSQEENTSL